MCVQHGSICHIAVLQHLRAILQYVCMCHVVVCSMITLTPISHYIYVLQTSSTHHAATASLPHIQDAFCPETDFLRAVPETASQLLAMHGCCQQAKCIGKGGQCETHHQEKAPGVTQHAKVVVTHICLLCQAGTCLPRVRLRSLQAHFWVML